MHTHTRERDRGGGKEGVLGGFQHTGALCDVGNPRLTASIHTQGAPKGAPVVMNNISQINNPGILSLEYYLPSNHELSTGNPMFLETRGALQGPSCILEFRDSLVYT